MNNIHVPINCQFDRIICSSSLLLTSIAIVTTETITRRNTNLTVFLKAQKFYENFFPCKMSVQLGYFIIT